MFGEEEGIEGGGGGGGASCGIEEGEGVSGGGRLAGGGPRDRFELVLTRCGDQRGEGEISDSRRRRDMTAICATTEKQK